MKLEFILSVLVWIQVSIQSNLEVQFTIDGSKYVSASTDYVFSLQLTSVLPANSILELDFSNTQVGTTDGKLQTCYHKDMFTNGNKVDYTDCVVTSKVARIVISGELQSGIMLKLYIGKFTNPPYQMEQKVKMKLTYNTVPQSSTNQDVSLTQNLFTPQVMTDAIIEQSSYKVLASTVFTFKFKSINNIAQGSKVQVTIPNEHSIVSTSAISVDGSIGSNSVVTFTSANGRLVQTSNVISLTGLFTTNYVVDNQYIIIKVSYLTNTGSVGVSTTGFIVQVLSSQNYLQEQTDNTKTLISQTKESEDITITQFTPFGADMKINKVFNLYLAFKPNIAYAKSAQLIITFPSELSLDATQVLGSRTSSGGSLTVQTTQNRIIFRSISNGDASGNTVNQFIVISGIINPKSTKKTSKIQLQIYNENGNLIQESKIYDSTIQALAGLLTVSSQPQISVNNLDKNVDLTVSINLANPIDQGAKIQLVLPKSVFGIVNTNPTCQQLTGTSINCAIIINNSTMTIMNLDEFCSNGGTTCPAMAVMQFKVINTFKNPSFITIPSKSMEIKTITSDSLGVYDQKLTSIFVTPNLVTNTFTDLTMKYESSSSSSTVYNKLDKYVVEFTPFDYFKTNGNTVYIKFPKGSLILIDSSDAPRCHLSVTGTTSTCAYQLYNTDDTLDGIYFIKMTNVCNPTSCSGKIILTITNFYAPLSNQAIDTSINKYMTETLTSSGYSISSGSLSQLTNYDSSNLKNLQEVNVGLKSTYQLSSQIVGKTDQTLTLTIQYNIPFTPLNHDVFQMKAKVQLPTSSGEFIIPSTSQCTVDNVDTIQFSCTITDRTNGIIELSYQQTEKKSTKTWKLLLNKNIVITLTKLTNIQSLKPSSNIIQQSFTGSNHMTQEASGSMSNQITLTQVSELTKVEVIRNINTVHQIVILSIKITLKNKLYYADSIVQITIPFQQVNFVTTSVGSTLQASDITGSLQITRDNIKKTIQNVQIGTEDIIFSFKESCPCDITNVLIYQFQNNPSVSSPTVNIRNPQVNQLVTKSVQVKTFDKSNYGVDQKISNVFISPTLETGKITFNSITTGNRILYEKTTLTINIKLQTKLEKQKQAKLTIQFPNHLYYPDKQGSSYALNCYVKTTKLTTCSSTLTNESNDSNQPKYISIATLEFTDAEVDVFNVFALTDFDLKIDNMYNYYQHYTASGSSDIVMTTTVTTNNVIINQVTFSIIGKNLYPNTKNQMKSVAMERTNYKIDQSTVVKFTLQFQQIIKANNYINIRIPKTQLKATNVSPICKFVVGVNVNTVTCKLTHETDYMNIEMQNSLISYCNSNTFLYFCDVDSSFVIQLDNLINHYELPNLSLIKYFKFSLKDTTNTNLMAESESDQSLLTPVLQPGTFQNLVFKSDNGIVAKSNVIDISGQLEAQLLAQSKLVISLNSDIILIANDYKFGCKLAIMDQNSQFSVQDLKDVQCQYKLNPLTNAITEIIIVNPCRFDSSCPQNTKVNIQFQSANLLYKQTYSGQILLTGYTSNNRLTLQSEIPLSSLTALTQYELLLSDLVITRNVDTASVSSEITIDFKSPIRLISKAQLIFYISKDTISISSKPSCQAVIPLGFDCAFTFSSSNSQYYTITVIQNYCDSFNFMYCEPNQQLKFILKTNVNNPARLKLSGIQYNKVEVSYNSNQIMSLVQNYNNVITPLIKTSAIKSIKVTRSSRPAYSVTNLDIELELSTNLPNDGQLLLQFPNEVLIKNGVTSPVVKRYSDNQYSSQTRDMSSSCTTQYNTNNYLQQILISSVCSGDCNAATKIYIRIEQLKNNYYLTKQDEILRIASLDNQQYVIDSGSIKNSQIINQIEPEDTQSISITRSILFYTLESEYSFIIDFKSSQFIESTTKVRLSLPSSQLVFGGNTFYLKDKSNNKIVLTKVQKYTSSYMIEFRVVSSSQTKYEFTLVGFHNAISNPTKDISHSVFVELYTVQDQQMTKNKNQVIITPDMVQQVTQISDLVITQDNFIDGQVTKLTYSFRLKSLNTDGDNDYIVQLPQYRYYYQNYNEQTKLNCQVYNEPLSKYEDVTSNDCQATYDSTHKYIEQVKFIKICNSKIFCNVNNQKMELIFQIRNQPSLRPFYKNTVDQYFSLLHYKNNVEQFKNQYLYIQPELTASDIKSIQVKSNDLTINKQNLELDLQFSLSNIVAIKGNISIQLPSQLIQSIPSSCVSDQIIKGTKKTMICKPTSDGLIAIVQDYQIVDTYDLYEQIQMRVVVQGIQNPMTNLLTDPFVIRSYGMYVEDSYKIDQNQQVVQYQATQLGVIKVTSVTRSNSDLYTDVVLNIALEIQNEIPIHGFIMIDVLDSYQFEFKVNDGSKITCQNKLNSGNVIVCYIYKTFIKVTSLCGTNTKCNAGTKFELEFSSGIRNPIIANEKSMKIYSSILYKAQHGYIDGLTSNILAINKLQKTVLTMDLMKRDTHNCIEDIKMEVQFKSANRYNFVNRSKFMIEFTRDIVFLSQMKTLKCNVNGVKDVKCDVNYFTDQTDVQSIQYLNVYGFCVTNDPCIQNEVINIKIDGLINGYEETDYNSKQVKFRTCITDYNKVYQEAELVVANLNVYFQKSVATGSTQVTFRPMNPLSQFSNTLQIIMAVNTFQIKDMYILIDYDKTVYTKSFNSAICQSQFGFDNQVCKVEKVGDSQVKLSNFISKSKSNLTLALIELQDFQNAKITNGQNNQQFNFQQIRLMSSNNLVMEKYQNTDKMTYKIYKKRSLTGCTDTNCEYCLEDDKGYCISCKSPGEYPLLYQNIFDMNQKPKCMNQCPDDTFSHLGGCYNCHQTCSKCYGPVVNNCQQCNKNSVYQYFDSGKCLKSCMKYSQPVQNDNIYPIQSSYICKQSTTTRCNTTLCPNGSCMNQNNYCSEQCGNNMAFSFYKQECVGQTSCSNDGTHFSLYSSYQNKNNVQYKYCKQCISKCNKCTDDKQTECIECNPSFTNKFNYQQACVKTCPQSNYAELNTNICKKCADKCTQCRDGSSSNCLSCQQDKKYYYGECLDKCPIGTITQNDKCLSNCNNKSCYQCSTDSNKCSSCRGTQNIIHNDNCYSKCPQGTFYQNGKCGTCKSECKSCDDGQKCSLCKDSTKSVFKGQCVDSCPEGYSKNYLTTQCMQFYCDSPCSTCGFNENQCWTCSSGQYQIDLKCQSSCPSTAFTNSTDLKQCQYCQSPCDSCSSLTACNTCKSPLLVYETQCYQTCPMQYEPTNGICKFSNYPVQAIIIWCLFILNVIYFTISHFKQKTKMNKINSLIFLAGPLQFLTRICLFINYWYLIQTELMAITFITLATNCILALMFKTYYLTLFEENLKSFQVYIKNQPKFYKICKNLMVVIGVKVAKILNSGLLFIPKSNFEVIPPYLFSLNRLLYYSLILSIFQLMASIYTLITFNSAKDGFHLASQDLLFTIIGELSFYYKNYQDIKMKLGYDQLPERPDNHYDDENQQKNVIKDLEEDDLQKGSKVDHNQEQDQE